MLFSIQNLYERNWENWGNWEKWNISTSPASGFLAMLANFCTVMPITAFADDDIDAEVQTTDSNGHRYQLFDTSMSWTDAESYCESIGGHLVTITSAEEQQYIIENLLPTGTKNTYFIGLSRDTDTAEWSWVTSEPFDYTN